MTVKRRWQKHQSEANKGSGWALHRSMRKHGIDAFEVHVLAEGLDREAAGEMEQQMIVKHVTRTPFGYNMTDGGDGSWGYRHTEEWKAELSRRQKGRKMPPEAIERRRQALIGYVHSPEARANMSAAHIGLKHPCETINKMQESALHRWQVNPRISTLEEQERLRTLRLGVKNTPEHSAAIAAALTGKPKSEAHKAKMKKPKSPEHREALRQASLAAWARKKADDAGTREC